MLATIHSEAEQRYAKVAAGDVTIIDNSPTLVLMLNTSEAINAILSDKPSLADWNNLMSKLKAMNICIVFGALDNVSIPYSSEILKKFKDDRKMIFFDDLSNLKIGEVPYPITKKFAGTLQSGDGYCIINNNISRVRVPDCPSTER